jgi:hypothetical protein
MIALDTGVAASANNVYFTKTSRRRMNKASVVSHYTHSFYDLLMVNKRKVQKASDE